MNRVFKYLLVLFLALATVAQAGDTHVNVRQDGMILKVEGWLTTPVEHTVAWGVLTDYGNFPLFVPGVRSNRVMDQRGNVKTVAQQGEMAVGSLRMPYEGTMRIEESPGEGLDIHFLTGLFKDVRGQWRMGNGKPLRLTYRMQMDLLKTIIPAPLVTPLAEAQVRMWVTVFAQEMERRQGQQ